MATNETNKLIFGTTTYNLKDDSGTASNHTHTKSQITDFPTIPDTSTFMQKGVDYVTAGQKYGTTLGGYATAEGNSTTASGKGSHAEGNDTTAMEESSHAEGSNTMASGASSHAEGSYTTASGGSSHAEGYRTTASGASSHAEGSYTTASGNRCSHAEGYNTTASHLSSHAEGYNTTASGDYSHAEGYNTTASGISSHAGGFSTTAQRKSQTVIGEYNIADTGGSGTSTRGTYAFIIGNGTANDARSNALTVDWDGYMQAYGIRGNSGGLNLNSSLKINAPGVDIVIPTDVTDGNFAIAPTFSDSDTYAVGDYVIYNGQLLKCTTAHSASAWNHSHFIECINKIVSTDDIIGKTFEATGSDYAEKFETLEDCPACRFVTLDGEKIKLAQPEDDYILGITSELPSIIGDKMNQGTPVGLLGKLWVECDDTVKINSFVTSGKDGIATKSDKGYRVMAVDGNKCKVLVK